MCPSPELFEEKWTRSQIIQFDLRSCLWGPDKDGRLYAPPANNVNRDPEAPADVVCSSTGGIAGSNSCICPTWCPALRSCPCSLQCGPVFIDFRTETHHTLLWYVTFESYRVWHYLQLHLICFYVRSLTKQESFNIKTEAICVISPRH